MRMLDSRNLWEKITHQHHYKRHVNEDIDNAITEYINKLHERPIWPRTQPVAYSYMSSQEDLSDAASRVLTDNFVTLITQAGKIEPNEKLELENKDSFDTGTEIDAKTPGHGIIMAKNGQSLYLDTHKTRTIVARRWLGFDVKTPQMLQRTPLETIYNGVTTYPDLEAELNSRPPERKRSDADLTEALMSNAAFKNCSELEQTALLMSFDGNARQSIVFEGPDDTAEDETEKLSIRLNADGRPVWLIVENLQDRTLPTDKQWKNGYSISVIPDYREDVPVGAKPHPNYRNSDTKRLRSASDIAHAVRNTPGLSEALKSFSAHAETIGALDTISTEIIKRNLDACDYQLSGPMFKVAMKEGTSIVFEPIPGRKGEESQLGILSDNSKLYINTNAREKRNENEPIVLENMSIRHQNKNRNSDSLAKHYAEAIATAKELPGLASAMTAVFDGYQQNNQTKRNIAELVVAQTSINDQSQYDAPSPS